MRGVLTGDIAQAPLGTGRRVLPRLRCGNQLRFERMPRWTPGVQSRRTRRGTINSPACSAKRYHFFRVRLEWARLTSVRAVPEIPVFVIAIEARLGNDKPTDTLAPARQRASMYRIVVD